MAWHITNQNCVGQFFVKNLVMWTLWMFYCTIWTNLQFATNIHYGEGCRAQHVFIFNRKYCSISEFANAERTDSPPLIAIPTQKALNCCWKPVLKTMVMRTYCKSCSFNFLETVQLPATLKMKAIAHSAFPYLQLFFFEELTWDFCGGNWQCDRIVLF